MFSLEGKSKNEKPFRDYYIDASLHLFLEYFNVNSNYLIPLLNLPAKRSYFELFI